MKSVTIKFKTAQKENKAHVIAKTQDEIKRLELYLTTLKDEYIHLYGSEEDLKHKTKKGDTLTVYETTRRELPVASICNRLNKEEVITVLSGLNYKKLLELKGSQWLKRFNIREEKKKALRVKLA